MAQDSRNNPEGGGAQPGLRFAGGLLVLTGTAFLVVATVVGVVHLAPEEGAWHALSLVFSVGSLTGQIAPTTGAGSRVVMMALAVWMATCYLTMTVGAGLLVWDSMRLRHRGPTRGR